MSAEPQLAHNVRQVVPFFCITDMDRSLRYYIDGLGFTRTNQWIVDGKIRWCWLQLGGAALMLQTCGQKILDSLPTGAKLSPGASLWFQCEDAIVIYHQLRSRGIEASEPQVGNGLWDTVLTDPAGYKLHFESPAEVPEETTLAEWQTANRLSSDFRWTASFVSEASRENSSSRQGREQEPTCGLAGYSCCGSSDQQPLNAGRLGDGQFQGNAIDLHAAGPTGQHPCGRLSRTTISKARWTACRPGPARGSACCRRKMRWAIMSKSSSACR